MHLSVSSWCCQLRGKGVSLQVNYNTEFDHFASELTIYWNFFSLHLANFLITCSETGRLVLWSRFLWDSNTFYELSFLSRQIRWKSIFLGLSLFLSHFIYLSFFISLSLALSLFFALSISLFQPIALLFWKARMYFSKLK